MSSLANHFNWLSPLMHHDYHFFSCYLVGAVISGKPSSVIVEEGQNVTLVCQATGQPTPTVTWSKLALLYHNIPNKTVSNVEGGKVSLVNVTKSQGGDYICLAKNLLNQDSALVQVIVLEALKITILPPRKSLGLTSGDVILPCSAQGARDIVWQRTSQSLPTNHILYSNGSLLLKNISPNFAGSYTCTARNFHRSVKASTSLEVRKPISCSEFKSSNMKTPSGNYMIDPDGNGGVTPFSVYCDMSDKDGVGVTVVSHDSESRTHVGPNGCGSAGCYSKDVRYTGVSTAQLAALTRVSRNCDQFIKFECNNDVAFIEHSYAWWVSRDGTRMNYWGGATGHDNMCACGVTNSCTGGTSCNCDNSGSGWYEDSGLLTDKSALPVTQIRLGDLNGSNEEGYLTLGKLMCYGQA